MAKKSSLATLVAGILAVTTLGNLSANAQQTVQQPPVSASALNSNTRVVQEPLIREFRKTFCYDLSSERGYSVSYMASVNNQNLCRIVNVDKVNPGDVQLQLVEKKSETNGKTNCSYWRIIQLPYFLDQTKQYDVTVIDSCGKERPLDKIKPGDKTLKFYGPAIRIPGEKRALELRPRTFENGEPGVHQPKNPPKNLFYKAGPRCLKDLGSGSFEVETPESKGRKLERFGR